MHQLTCWPGEVTMLTRWSYNSYANICTEFDIKLPTFTENRYCWLQFLHSLFTHLCAVIMEHNRSRENNCLMTYLLLSCKIPFSLTIPPTKNTGKRLWYEIIRLIYLANVHALTLVRRTLYLKPDCNRHACCKICPAVPFCWMPTLLSERESLLGVVVANFLHRSKYHPIITKSLAGHQSGGADRSVHSSPGQFFDKTVITADLICICEYMYLELPNSAACDKYHRYL